MANRTLNDNNLRMLLKSAFAETLEEQRALVQEIVEDALEKIALTRAIDQGLRTKPVSRAAIFKILVGK